MTLRLGPTPALPAASGWTAALGIRPEQLTRWAAAGLLRTSAGADLRLTDATLVRSLCRRPGPAKLRAALDRLRAWLPAAWGPPGPVTLVCHGGAVLVRLADGTLADPAGQFRFDFDAHGPLGRISPAAPTTAAEWHEHAIAQDLAGDAAAAVDGYAVALLLAGPDAQVAFDLAAALADLGQRDRAIERYRQVVELEPTRQDAWVNLGDLHLAAGDAAAAVAAFRRALDLQPDDAAAHYNLADAFDLAGEPLRAAPHWDAFLRLAAGPLEQVTFARSRLRR